MQTPAARSTPTLTSNGLRSVAAKGIWFFVFVAFMTVLSRSALATNNRTLNFENIDSNSISQLKSDHPNLFKNDWSLSELNLAVNDLMAKKNFDEVTVVLKDGTTNQFVVRAVPTRRVSALQIHGTGALSRSDIQDFLGIKVGDRFDRKQLVNGAERIKERYGQMGFYNASLEIGFETPNPQEIIVKVDVQEGEPCRIIEIDIDTPNLRLKDALLRQVIRFKGKPLTEDRLNSMRERFQNYFRENRYIIARTTDPTIDYNDDKSRARVKLRIENPYRYSLIFEGNKIVTTPTLLRALDLSAFTPSSTSPEGEIAARLGDIYRNRGYAFVTIRHSEKTMLSKNFLRQVTFRIDEGPRVRIREMTVVGSFSKDPSYYTDFVRDNSSSLVSSGYYNREAIDLGGKNLQVELQNSGFLNAKVFSVRAEFDPTRQYATVIINLEEGPLTRIRSISFTGNEKISKDDLLEQLELNADAPLSLVALEQGLERIKTFYQNHGYLEMAILNEKQKLVHYSDDNSEADLNIEIYEGPQVRIASIIIEGNTKTKDYVIRQEIAFKDGDILTPEAISESQTRLLRLGIFSNVTIRTLEAGTNIPYRTVIVSIEEANPGVFNAGIGANDEAQFTMRTYVGAGYNNINGTARAVTARADVDYSTNPLLQFPNNSIAFGYYEPFLFRTRTRGRISLIRLQRWFEAAPDSNGRNTLTIQESMDGKFLLERNLTLNIKFIWQLYGYETLRFYERNDILPENDSANIASVGPTLEMDYRNNPLNPSKGTFSKWTTEYARPEFGGSRDSGYFVRTDAQVTHYIPINESKWVWANQVRGGFLQNLSDRDQSGVPAVRAFLLGGRSTVRGFDPALDRFPTTRTLSRNDNPDFRLVDFRVHNNSSYYLVKTELRFPIYGNFGGQIFYDGGAVFISDYSFIDPYRDSVGFGFRYNTPVGPVNVELGYKIDRKYLEKEQPKADRYRIHFSIGTF